MEVFKGECEVHKDGNRICAGTYEIYRETGENELMAEIGFLEVADIGISALVNLFNQVYADPRFQLVIKGKKHAIQLRALGSSADFQKGRVKFIFRLESPDGGI